MFGDLSSNNLFLDLRMSFLSLLEASRLFVAILGVQTIFLFVDTRDKNVPIAEISVTLTSAVFGLFIHICVVERKKKEETLAHRFTREEDQIRSSMLIVTHVNRLKQTRS
jgi:hypothetical protein